MRPLEFIALIVGVALIVTLLMSLGALHAPQPEKAVIEYKDFISILLTAITVALAVLALGIAALAIWGYKEFMSKAHDSAVKVADDSVKAYLDSPAFVEALARIAEPYYREQARADVVPGATQVATDAPASGIPRAPQ